MRKTNCNLSHERLQEVLDYDPDTGIFRWKVPQGKGRIKSGDVAGSVGRSGYHRIDVEKTKYQAHRLVWLYMTGAWPAMDIDHINRIKSDNRFVNLREATDVQNGQNSRASRGKSRWRGVHWHAHAKKWQARISVNGKQRHLGLFDTEEDAAEAYQSAQRRFHPYAPGLDSLGQCSGQE